MPQSVSFEVTASTPLRARGWQVQSTSWSASDCELSKNELASMSAIGESICQRPQGGVRD
jgi:hypothetical protein